MMSDAASFVLELAKRYPDVTEKYSGENVVQRGEYKLVWQFDTFSNCVEVREGSLPVARLFYATHEMLLYDSLFELPSARWDIEPSAAVRTKILLTF